MDELIIEGEWRYSQNKMKEMAEKKELYLTNKLYLRRIVIEPRSKMLKDLLFRVDKEEVQEKKDELLEEYEKKEVDYNNLSKEQEQHRKRRESMGVQTIP